MDFTHSITVETPNFVVTLDADAEWVRRGNLIGFDWAEWTELAVMELGMEHSDVTDTQALLDLINANASWAFIAMKKA